MKLLWSFFLNLHLENFGSYKSENRLIYFDINDFDEAYFGACTLDITRLLVSIIVSGKEFGFSKKVIKHYCNEFLNEYFNQMQLGHASRIEYQISSGIIKTYLQLWGFTYFISMKSTTSKRLGITLFVDQFPSQLLKPLVR